MKTDDAIKHFEGVGPLANALGITRSAVYQWGAHVPELRALQLERLTGGALTLRPAPSVVHPEK